MGRFQKGTVRVVVLSITGSVRGSLDRLVLSVTIRDVKEVTETFAQPTRLHIPKTCLCLALQRACVCFSGSV